MPRGEEAVGRFRAKYQARHPPPDRITHEDQVRKLGDSEGVRYIEVAPISDVIPGHPPQADGPGRACYLWVIDEDGVPIILENAAVANDLHDRAVKHTNLTGGGPAYCGGEVWFRSATTDQVFVSGGSGRYGPQGPEELEDAVAVFRGFGFATDSLGWDPQTNKPLRVWRPDD